MTPYIENTWGSNPTIDVKMGGLPWWAVPSQVNSYSDPDPTLTSALSNVLTALQNRVNVHFNIVSSNGEITAHNAVFNVDLGGYTATDATGAGLTHVDSYIRSADSGNVGLLFHEVGGHGLGLGHETYTSDTSVSVMSAGYTSAQLALLNTMGSDDWLELNQLYGSSHSYLGDWVGNSSNNTIFGGTGVVDPGDGSEHVYGGGGDDVIYLNGGNDTGAGGSSTSDTSAGNDTIYGGGGTDSIYGNGGNDQLYGGGAQADPADAPDQIFGGAGSDTEYGNGGNDTLFGGVGVADPNDAADTIHSGAGNDYVYGNGGDDWLFTDASGNDTLAGGGGFDRFFIGLQNSAQETILGFEHGIDKVVLPIGTAYTISGSNLNLPGGEVVHFDASFTSGDLLFQNFSSYL